LDSLLEDGTYEEKEAVDLVRYVDDGSYAQFITIKEADNTGVAYLPVDRLEC